MSKTQGAAATYAGDDTEELVGRVYQKNGYIYMGSGEVGSDAFRKFVIDNGNVISTAPLLDYWGKRVLNHNAVLQSNLMPSEELLRTGRYFRKMYWTQVGFNKNDGGNGEGWLDILAVDLDAGEVHLVESKSKKITGGNIFDKIAESVNEMQSLWTKHQTVWLIVIPSSLEDVKNKIAQVNKHRRMAFKAIRHSEKCITCSECINCQGYSENVQVIFLNHLVDFLRGGELPVKTQNIFPPNNRQMAKLITSLNSGIESFELQMEF